MCGPIDIGLRLGFQVKRIAGGVDEKEIRTRRKGNKRNRQQFVHWAAGGGAVKKLGLVGGIGPESTVMYYRGIVDLVQEDRGKECFPPMTIECVEMPRMLAYCADEDYEGLCVYLHQAVATLAHAGADFAALSSNTPHIVFDELVERVSIPLVSIVGETARSTAALGVGTVGLLGTGFTMENSFYQDTLAREGVTALVPTAEERVFINERIFSELEYGIVTEETRDAFLEIVSRLQREEGIEAVILGCTELPLIFDGQDVAVPTIDTTRIHIAALAEQVLS